MNLSILPSDTRAHRDHLALLGLLLGGIGDDDAARGLVFLLDPTDQDAVLQRTEFHSGCLLFEIDWLFSTLCLRVLLADGDSGRTIKAHAWWRTIEALADE